VDFYLADYRFADSNDDYIVDSWRQVDLSSLGHATRVTFALSSSDVGMFGMNTPAYFAVDQIVLDDGTLPAATGFVHRNDADLGESLTVQVHNDDASELWMPPTVTIPSGQATAPFPIYAVNDFLVDGLQVVTVAAKADQYTEQGATLLVEDDDVSTLSLTLDPDSVSELDGESTGVVHRNVADTSEALEVTLTASSTVAITLPDTVTIAAGQLAVAFDVGVSDNALVDGTRLVEVQAEAIGFAAGQDTLEITDWEELVLSIFESSMNENAGQTAATVTRTDPNGDLTVFLLNGDATEISLPASIVIPDGETTSAEFLVTAVNDGIDDGTQTATVVASADGYIDAAGEIEVTDYQSWQSPTHPLDVNVDGFITPLDALLIINELNKNGSRELPIPYPDGFAPPPYYDVSGDRVIAPQDAVIVINFLNAFGSGAVPPVRGGGAEGEAEGEGDARRNLASADPGQRITTDQSHQVVTFARSVQPRESLSSEAELHVKNSGADRSAEWFRGFLTGFSNTSAVSMRDGELGDLGCGHQHHQELEEILEAIAAEIDEAWS
jgi:hypothetical protein